MMSKKRLALCFSGQLRNVDRGYQHIKKNILDPNKTNWEIDVFVHTWFQQQDVGKAYMAANGTVASNPLPPTCLSNVYEFYNPTKMLIEKQIKFEEHNFGQRKASLIVPWYSLSKCHSIQKSIELKREHELTEGFTYDLVMTCRFDLGLGAPIVLEYFNPDAVNTSTHGVSNGIGVDVTHAIMNSENADTYGSILKHVQRYYNEGTLFCDEHFFHKHLDCHEIPINRTPLLNNYILLRT